MSVPYSYHPFLSDPLVNGNLLLDAEESYHLCRVLRVKKGGRIMITDGKGYLAEGIVQDADTKHVAVELLNDPDLQKQRDFFIHIAIAPTRHPDRLEWFAEKATEIGVDRITFIITKHSEKWNVKLPRLQRILISAMKQSQQAYLPFLTGPLSFEEFLPGVKEEERWIGYCNEEARPLAQSANKGRSGVIAIGPEGDFAPEEVAMAKKNGFIPINLGSTRLRTETAGWVALHTIHIINQIQ